MSEPKTTTIDAAKIDELRGRAPKGDGKASGTTYIVLRRDDPEGREIGDMLKWTVIGRATTPNAETAIRDVATNLLEGKAGTFVAIPARSWKPVTVKAEQTVVLKLEEAK